MRAETEADRGRVAFIQMELDEALDWRMRTLSEAETH